MKLDTTADHETAARARFDDWSETNTFRRLRPWLALVQGQVLDRIDWSRTQRFLDVACGSGWAVREAARRLRRKPGGLAVGCDISQGMLNQRAGQGSDAELTAFLAASAQSLPYATSSFDALIVTAAFHHFPVPEEALLEFRRVLRPGGMLLIADTCRDQSLGTWIWDRLHRWFEKGHVKYYRRDELRELLGDSGFVQVELRELTPTYAESKKLVGNAALFSAVSPPN